MLGCSIMLDTQLLAWFTRLQSSDEKTMRVFRRWFDDVPNDPSTLPEELRQQHVRLNVLFMQRMHDDATDSSA